MATFPTFESVLLQIAKALGTTGKISSKSKSKFKHVDMSMDNLSDTWENILGDIADALGLDEGAKNDLISNIYVDYQMHKSIELGIYSSKATQRKIVWQYLARVLVPALARHTVFWQIESKIDEGMPGGRFWYLPAFDSPIEPTQLLLPVPQVLHWLIDLIQESNTTIASNLEEDLRIYDSSGTVLRNLYNWKNAKSTPEISSINSMFPDEVKIQFLGCFEPNEQSSQFVQALAYVENKGLLPRFLQHEIAINEDRLKRILNADCSAEEQQDFVNKLKLRYQAPSAKTIRSRLIIARAIQEGYEQLVKFLTPTVDKLSIDLNKNKTLQLVQLYNDVYNRTLEAHIEKGDSGEFAENKYFTETLPPFLRYDLLLSVASNNEQPTPLISNRLNCIFSRSGEEATLDNILPTSEDDIRVMTKVINEEVEHSNNYVVQLGGLVEKLTQNKTPFKQLQKMKDFEVVYGAINHHYPNQKIWPMIINRLSELETSSEHSMKRILLELEYHLLVKTFDSNTEAKVCALLEEAKNCDDFEFSKAKVLQFEAFHFIAQNNLSEAEKNLNLAIEECKKYSFGKLRGNLARDAFSLAIANQKLIPNNHEKYFRDMTYWGCFEEGTERLGKVDIYNVSRNLHKYFWEELYKNYPNYQPLFASSLDDLEAFSSDFAACIKGVLPLDQVLKKHKGLRKKQLKYPQADSVMSLMMKMSYDMLAKLTCRKQSIPAEVATEVSVVFTSIINAIRLMIELWPEIINVSDFKQQTPLMLAAHNKDHETVEALLKADADPNLRDFTGRTALHAAVASRCLRSAALILEYGCDATITSLDGATALHTATRMGERSIVELLIEKRPELLQIEDRQGFLPEQLAKAIATDPLAYKLLRQYLLSECRTVVAQETYEEMLEVF